LMRGLAAGDAPFFLFVNLNIAHLPYTPPEASYRRFASEPWPEPKVARLRSVKGGWGHLAGWLRLDAADFQILRDLYEAEVAVADELAGGLIETLGALDLLDRTLVIVTSDHGENLGDHGMIDHVYSMFDTTIRVPLIVRYPARFAAGGEVAEPVSLVDVVPTVLDVCGIGAVGAELPGIPLGDRAAAARAAVFAENGRPINGLELLRLEFPEFDASAIDHRIRMIRAGRHKLIWKTGVSAELFDLATDPGEHRDVESSLPELRDRLLGELRAWSVGIEPTQPARPFESRDRESLERLRALGYVE
jgi:arylsulfatase A-like enzyme